MTQKKAILLSGTILVVLGVVVVFLLNQNILKRYYISSPANEPGLKVGTQVMASSLSALRPMDFAVFNFDDPQFGEVVYIFRAVALANDTVQIDNGVLFVNGENKDDDMNLKHMYQVHDDVYFQLEEQLKPHDYIHPPGGFGDIDSVLIYLEDRIADTYPSHRKVLSRTENDYTIEGHYDKFWNKDQKFGSGEPIVYWPTFSNFWAVFDLFYP